MHKNRQLVAQANKLSTDELDRLIRTDDERYQVKISSGKDLSSNYREKIFDLFERNMKTFYEQSSAGYSSGDKRKELFDERARYLLIFSSNELMAFVHFRFDLDYRRRVIYLYELQVNDQCQGQGIGQWLIDRLKQLANKTQMEKIVLTVFKSNERAVEFYRKKCRFTNDETNPDDDDDDVDYQILSFDV